MAETHIEEQLQLIDYYNLDMPLIWPPLLKPCTSGLAPWKVSVKFTEF